MTLHALTIKLGKKDSFHAWGRNQNRFGVQIGPGKGKGPFVGGWPLRKKSAVGNLVLARLKRVESNRSLAGLKEGGSPDEGKGPTGRRGGKKKTERSNLEGKYLVKMNSDGGETISLKQKLLKQSRSFKRGIPAR